MGKAFILSGFRNSNVPAGSAECDLESTRVWTTGHISARGKSRHGIRPSLHPGGLRCDSVTYSRYAPSSRLVRRAQERSRCSRDFHHGLISARGKSRHGIRPSRHFRRDQSLRRPLLLFSRSFSASRDALASRSSCFFNRLRIFSSHLAFFFSSMAGSRNWVSGICEL